MMTAKLRIMHVIPSVAEIHGGPSRAIAMIESSLQGRAAVTTVTTDDAGPRSQFRAVPSASEAYVTRVYHRKWLDFYKVCPGIVFWLWANVRSFNVVHIHALFSFTSVCAALVARVRGVPYVIRPLGTIGIYGMSRRRPWLKRLSWHLIEGPLVRRAAAVHFTSELERVEAELLGKFPRPTIIPIGIASPEFPLRPSEVGAGRSVEILYLSRLDPKKNIECLMMAFAKLTLKCDSVRLLIAGSGSPDYIERLHRVAAELGLSSRIEWLGYISGDAKLNALRRAAVFVLPSASENFGIAAVEAMLVGLPVVLTAGVAIAAEASEAGAAVVVEPSPDMLADKLLALIENPELRKRLGLRAAAFAHARYSVEAMGERLMNMYWEIVNER